MGWIPHLHGFNICVHRDQIFLICYCTRSHKHHVFPNTSKNRRRIGTNTWEAKMTGTRSIFVFFTASRLDHKLHSVAPIVSVCGTHNEHAPLHSCLSKKHKISSNSYNTMLAWVQHSSQYYRVTHSGILSPVSLGSASTTFKVVLQQVHTSIFMVTILFPTCCTATTCC